MAAILAITSGAYAALRVHGGTSADPAAIAAASVRSSHAASVLEQARQREILLDAAAKSTDVESAPSLAQPPSSDSGGSIADENAPPPDPGTAQSIAYNLLPSFGFSAAAQFPCLNDIYSRESGWRYNAENGESGAYGIPQALPGSKMATAGPDWQTDVTTQIRWGLGYIQGRYGTPCGAWSFWEAHSWY
ncbi:MAG: lytic transglycosylase domain-containing protein [Streptosporangiaceae bacterium]